METENMQFVIPGDHLCSEMKGRFFVYKANCRAGVCNHIYLQPSLNNILKYMSKKDCVELAKQHGIFPLDHVHKIQRVHKSIILHELLIHERNCKCNMNLHFIEIFNHM